MVLAVAGEKREAVLAVAGEKRDAVLAGVSVCGRWLCN